MPNHQANDLIMSMSNRTSPGSEASTSSLISATSSHQFLDCGEDDFFNPNILKTNQTYHDARATWDAFVCEALDIPQGLWPASVLDPYITLVDVPALPSSLPRSHVIFGRPLWELRPRGGDSAAGNLFGDGTAAIQYGRRVVFILRRDSPIACAITPLPASCLLGEDSRMTGGLGILTICWSYIMSARFLEMQSRGIEYTSQRLIPLRSAGSEQPTLCLNNCSPTLIRWLCAILCPEPGWRALGTGCTPWAAYIQDDLHLSLSASVSDDKITKPPTSAEATYLLLELCDRFGLGTPRNQTDARWSALPPYKAAFFASLALPFYEFMGARPQFPRPRLIPAENSLDGSAKATIHQYVRDLPYFMTLSIHPPSVGTILWSIFWQADVECNLVTPWLAGVHDALKTNLDVSNMAVLLKTFAVRRPRVAVWWLALALLGDCSILDWIRRYTKTLMETYGAGSLSPPDPMVTAWTGSPQSFLDFDKTTRYANLSDEVSAADLLRCRYDSKLQDSASLMLSWQPLGRLHKKDVELELWPRLETDYVRRYHSFTWYRRQIPYPASIGFRTDIRRSIANVHDALRFRLSGNACFPGCSHELTLAPSKRATLTMLSLLVEDALGSRHSSNAAIPLDLMKHPWTRDWEGLTILDVPVDEELKGDHKVKSPSLFLIKWIEGQHEGQSE